MEAPPFALWKKECGKNLRIAYAMLANFWGVRVCLFPYAVG